MTTLIEIMNDGPQLVSTNYWQSEHARQGFAYLSGNAGALRLLVPPALGDHLADMRTARRVVIEPGSQPGLLDIVFDDDTDTPFVLSIMREQTDRALQRTKHQVEFLVYTSAGMAMRTLALITDV